MREPIEDTNPHYISSVFASPSERIEALMLPQEWAELCVSVNGSSQSSAVPVSARALAEYAVHQLFLTGMFMHNLCQKSNSQSFGRERLGVFQAAIRNETQSATQSIRRTEALSASLFSTRLTVQSWLCLLSCFITVVPSGALLRATGAVASPQDSLLVVTLLSFLPLLCTVPWLLVQHAHAMGSSVLTAPHSKPLFAFHRPLFSSESLDMPLLAGHARDGSGSPMRSPVLLSPDAPTGNASKGSYKAPKMGSPVCVRGGMVSPAGRPPRAPGTPQALLMPPLDEYDSAGDGHDDEHGSLASSDGAAVCLSGLLGCTVHAGLEAAFQRYLQAGGAPLDMDMVQAAAEGTWSPNLEVMLRNEMLLGGRALHTAMQEAARHTSAHVLAAALVQVAKSAVAQPSYGVHPEHDVGADLEATLIESPRHHSSRASPDGGGSFASHNPMEGALSSPSTTSTRNTPSTTRSQNSSKSGATATNLDTTLSSDTQLNSDSAPFTPQTEGGKTAFLSPSQPSTERMQPTSDSSSSGLHGTPLAVLTPQAAAHMALVPGAAWTVGRSLALRRAMEEGGSSRHNTPPFATPARSRLPPPSAHSEHNATPAHMAAVTSPDGAPTWAQAALGVSHMPAVAPPTFS